MGNILFSFDQRFFLELCDVFYYYYYFSVFFMGQGLQILFNIFPLTLNFILTKNDGMFNLRLDNSWYISYN